MTQAPELQATINKLLDGWEGYVTTVCADQTLSKVQYKELKQAFFSGMVWLYTDQTRNEINHQLVDAVRTILNITRTT
jgi:hypothetical protein